jgi:Amt family ammonium transporter
VSHPVSGVYGNVLTQLTGVLVVMGYSAVMTGLLLWLTRVLVGLRVDDSAETLGLDLSQHREAIGS